MDRHATIVLSNFLSCIDGKHLRVLRVYSSKTSSRASGVKTGAVFPDAYGFRAKTTSSKSRNADFVPPKQHCHQLLTEGEGDGR